LTGLNAKHFYGLMKKHHGLLLECHTARRRVREHDGQSATIRSNCRGYSQCHGSSRRRCRYRRHLGDRLAVAAVEGERDLHDLAVPAGEFQRIQPSVHNTVCLHSQLGRSPRGYILPNPLRARFDRVNSVWPHG
jgi:hypothetical protein